jgi:hypothetical protein
VWGPDPEKIASVVRTDDRQKAYVPLEQIPPQTAKDYLNWLRSNGNVPAALSDASAMERFRDRIQRAYGARLIGATRAQIETILKDQ